MPAKKHFLSNINEASRTASCDHCGDVKIHRHRGAWKCYPPDTEAHRERRREYTRRYRERHPDRIQAANQRYIDRRQVAPRILSEQLCQCGCGHYTYVSTYTDARKGVHKNEPLRFCHGHNHTGGGAFKKLRYVEEDRGYTTPCWIWQLKINRWGYGQERNTMAHRRAYERNIGPIPDGFDVDHMCHQRACVNPEHLQAVTRGENLWRMWMSRVGFSPVQITSLRQWMTANLTAEQIEAGWTAHVVD